MTTHLDQINVYLHENRMEIKSKSSNPLFVPFPLDCEESMLSEVKTCKKFRIFYNKENSSSRAIAADLRLTKVFPKLESIDDFSCSVQPSDVLKFLKDSPVKIEQKFNFMDLLMRESEKDDLSTLIIDYTEKFVGIDGINFPHLWLWDYNKARATDIHIRTGSKSALLQFFNKILDEGIPLCDPQGVLRIEEANVDNWKCLKALHGEIIKRGSVKIDTKGVGDQPIFEMEVEKTDGKKLFITIHDNTITIINKSTSDCVLM